MRVLTDNRKARHDFQVLDQLEAGIVLTGTEVKSCRARNLSLADAYAKADNGELWLVNAHIAPYEQGNRNNHEPRRPRKLLLQRRELRRLTQAIEAKGLTLVPLKVYLNERSLIKVELGLCRGRQQHDKRDQLKRQADERETQRAIRAHG
jgi:SsrA-binding protein